VVFFDLLRLPPSPSPFYTPTASSPALAVPLALNPACSVQKEINSKPASKQICCFLFQITSFCPLTLGTRASRSSTLKTSSHSPYFFLSLFLSLPPSPSFSLIL